MVKFNLTVLVKLKNIITISITESTSTMNLLINSQSGSLEPLFNWVLESINILHYSYTLE